jgi:predicted NAD-dependent protein-ADP-ribosyltransferase YbiA (DUF1768 family)
VVPPDGSRLTAGHFKRRAAAVASSPCAPLVVPGGTRHNPVVHRNALALVLPLLTLSLGLRAWSADPTNAAPPVRDPRYPAHWWTPVPKEGAPAWEILPQDAGPGEVILSKRNELGLLSNFAATPFTFHGNHYASLEGFWQMMKFPENADDPRAKFPGLDWKYTRDQVAQLAGFDAKHAGDLANGNMKKMGIAWVTFEGRRLEYKPARPGEHYKLIGESTRVKVLQNPDVKRVLLATGDLVLKPDHRQEAEAPAAGRYYEILMNLRAELQQAGAGSAAQSR